ncbi:MAG: GNAT family N-acetyltransferase [Hyphomicrobiales bacterium]|nr:GNAT family N-acetyltransferase [Hyphomicrobiales bacterium]MCP5372106.1 GNAT family N-acetyltransferase [Hyphomicrobiales bacterium]
MTSATGLRLEPAGPAHAAVMAAVQGACFDTAWDAETMATLLAAPGALGRIALDGEMPVAAILCRVAVDEAEILTLAVLPAARRAGVAAALLAEAEAEAARRGAAAMFLEVAADNGAALALYGGRGYRVTGHRRGYYRRAGGAVDAVLMVKDL